MQLDKFQWKMLLAEGDEFSEGGGGGDEIALDDSSAEPTEEEINLDNPEAAPVSGLTPDAIADAVRQGLSGFQRDDSQSRGAPQQFTPEQRAAFLKEMGRPEVNKDFVLKLLNNEVAPEERASALQELLDNVVQHALRVAGVAQNFHVTQLRQEIEPLTKLQEQRLQDEFFGQIERQFPTLKGHSKVIKMAAESMKRRGYASQGPEKDSLNLAVEAAKLIKGINPEFTLKRAKTSGGRPGMPAMAGSRSSAGGGGQNGGQHRQPMSNAQRLYFANKK